MYVPTYTCAKLCVYANKNRRRFASDVCQLWNPDVGIHFRFFGTSDDGYVSTLAAFMTVN